MDVEKNVVPAMAEEVLNTASNSSEDSPYTNLLEDIALVKNQLDSLEIQYNPNNIANLLLEYDNANRVNLVINRIIDEPPDVQITFERNSPEKASKSNSVPYRDCLGLNDDSLPEVEVIKSNPSAETDDSILEVDVVKKNDIVKARSKTSVNFISIDSDDEDSIPSPRKYFKSVDDRKNPFLANSCQQTTSSKSDETSSLSFHPTTSSKTISPPNKSNAQPIGMKAIEQFLESASKKFKSPESDELNQSVFKLNQHLNELKRNNSETISKAPKASSSNRNNLLELRKTAQENTISNEDFWKISLGQNGEIVNQQVTELENSPKSVKAKVQRVLDFASTIAKRDLEFGLVSMIGDSPSVPKKVSPTMDEKPPLLAQSENHDIEHIDLERRSANIIIDDSPSVPKKVSPTTDEKPPLLALLENHDNERIHLERGSANIASNIHPIDSKQNPVKKTSNTLIEKEAENSDTKLVTKITAELLESVKTSNPGLSDQVSVSSSSNSDFHPVTHLSLIDENLEKINSITRHFKSSMNTISKSNQSSVHSLAVLASSKSCDHHPISKKALKDHLVETSAASSSSASSEKDAKTLSNESLTNFLHSSGDRKGKTSNVVVNSANSSTGKLLVKTKTTSSKTKEQPHLLQDLIELDEILGLGEPRSSKPVASSSKVEVLHCEASTSGTSPSTSSKVKFNATSTSTKASKDEPMPEHLPNLMEIFPDADTNYLRDVCRSAVSKNSGKKAQKQQVLQTLIDTVFKNPDYPRRNLPQSTAKSTNLTYEEKCQSIYAIVPNIDPEFLEMKCKELIDNDRFSTFVNELLTNRQYPTIKDFEKRKETEKQMKAYTDNFTIPAFLEVFPDPEDYFLNKKPSSHPDHSISFLKDRYRYIRLDELHRAYKTENGNLTRTCLSLDFYKGVPRKTRRSQYDCKLPAKSDINFLQEISYIKNKAKIKEYLDNIKREREAAFRKAKENKELFTCGCCYDDEVMNDDVLPCPEGHIFCRNCLKQMGEIKLGERKSTIECMSEGCSAEFTLMDMQKVLAPNAFSRFVKLKQSDEIKAAGIEGLVACPFCDFASIPPPEDKIFKCLNPDCMKESCRLCNEESHIPLRCDEVERDASLKARLLIEEKMTEALMRECPKCKMKFIKSDGCNKMTCGHCGTRSCYICRQIVKDIKHFNGDGGDRVDLCPLFSDNDLLHVEAVQVTAELIKNKLLKENPDLALKIDPTLVLPEHQYNKHSVPAHRQQQRELVLNRVIPADVPRDNLPPIDLTRPEAPIGQNVHYHQAPHNRAHHNLHRNHPPNRHGGAHNGAQVQRPGEVVRAQQRPQNARHNPAAYGHRYADDGEDSGTDSDNDIPRHYYDENNFEEPDFNDEIDSDNNEEDYDHHDENSSIGSNHNYWEVVNDSHEEGNGSEDSFVRENSGTDNNLENEQDSEDHGWSSHEEEDGFDEVVEGIEGISVDYRLNSDNISSDATNVDNFTSDDDQSSPPLSRNSDVAGDSDVSNHSYVRENVPADNDGSDDEEELYLNEDDDYVYQDDISYNNDISDHLVDVSSNDGISDHQDDVLMNNDDYDHLENASFNDDDYSYQDDDNYDYNDEY